MGEGNLCRFIVKSHKRRKRKTKRTREKENTIMSEEEKIVVLFDGIKKSVRK